MENGIIMSKFNYTKEKPLRVFTAFSGYDSQCMALDRIGIPYELVGWSEIDKYAKEYENSYIRQRKYGRRNSKRPFARQYCKGL